MEDSIKGVTALLVVVAALLTAAVTFSKSFREFCKEIVVPLWPRARPLLKFIGAGATLLFPLALAIGVPFYVIAVYYWNLGSTEYLITNQGVFATLIALQTLLASLCFALWGKWVYPRVRVWLST